MARVLFLTYHFPTPQEAGSSRPWQEAMVLRELGFQVTVVTSGSNYMTGVRTRRSSWKPWSREEDQGFTVLKTYSPREHRRSKLLRLANYLLFSGIAFWAGLFVRRPRVVFAGTDPPFLVPVAYLLARLHGARLVLDERDVWPDVAVAVGVLKNKALIRLVDGFLGFFRRRAYSLITVSEGLKELLVSKGLPESRIHVIANAFPDGLSQRVSAPLPQDLAQGFDGAFVVLYTGGMGPGAAEIQTVLRAAKIVQQMGNGAIKFVFVGEGEKKQEYIRFCQEHAIANCAFFPAQSREVLPTLFARASVALHSLTRDSWMEKALSTKVFDYLFSAKPVVFAGSGEIANLINRAGAGSTVQPEDPKALAQAVLRLYDDRHLLEEMGRKGHEYVALHYSHQSLVEQFRLALMGEK